MSNPNQNLFPRGSEWRRWDLHVHSPFSALNNQYPKLPDGLPDWDKYIDRLDQITGISVLGITDYFSINGYKRILEYRKKGRLSNFDQILPNVELRLDTFVVKSKSKDINFHIIFSESLTPDEIDKEFLGALDIQVSGSISGLEGVRKLNERSLLKLGKNIRECHQSFTDDTDMVAALINITVSLEQVKELLRKDLFEDKFLLVLAGGEWSDIDWNQAYLTKKNFLQSAHILDTGSPDTINWALGRKDLSKRDFINEFGKLKPCIHGSDAHSLDTICQPDNDKYCWIKADPTFDGLIRILNEPEERVYIGEYPPKLIDLEKHRSKYISEISIKPTCTTQEEHWFNDKLTLNPGLVAVIGKKGSGKSAFVDIVALAGRSHINPDDYSFLRMDKFRKKGLAKLYEASMTSLDHSSSTTNLNDEVDSTSEVERVRYLPQVYVETICNETGVSERFQHEVNKVVFSYLPDRDKLGTSDLDSLIKKTTGASDDRLTLLRAKLTDQLKEKLALELKATDTYSKSLQNKLGEKQGELKAIVELKEVKKPASEPDEATKKTMAALKAKIQALDKAILKAESDLQEINTTIASLDNLTIRLSNFKRQFQDFTKSIKVDLDVLGLKVGDLVKVEIDNNKLNALRKGLHDQRKALQETLGIVSEDKEPEPGEEEQKKSSSLKEQKANQEKALTKIEDQLDSENKRYQKYITRMAEIEKRKKAIIGSSKDTSLKTIKSLRAEIEYVNKQLENDIKARDEDIITSCGEIFDTIAGKCNSYESVYKPLRDFIKKEIAAQERSESVLTFDVGIVCNKEHFGNQFLSFIDQGRDGSFQGKKEGWSRVLAISQNHSFDNKEGIVAFIDELIDNLLYDRTAQHEKPNAIEKQLIFGETKKLELLQWLYGLEYLDVKYKVLFNGKDLNQDEFSPGERGAILLIFYLLIDRENIPLIIDQPEENLDNESVYSLLVPYIKRAKQNRQIVIVTHNPNLAVVCDAEQIIYCRMDKSSNEIRYFSGSIENPNINRRIIDILEGTMPAFRKRDDAYIDGR